MADDQVATAAEFEFVFQHTSTGILLIEDGMLARLNPAAAALLSLGSEARGKPISALFAEQPKLLAALHEPAPRGEPVMLNNRREVRVMNAALKDGAQISLLEDTTARSTLDAGRAALIRQVAHDFRNPLNALGGFADLAATEPNASPEQIEYLERIQRIADKLYNLAGTLVDLAWIESGMPLHMQPIVLSEAIQAAADALGDDVMRREAAITLELPDDLPPALGDAAHLQQAIAAIIRNALFYAPLGSEVRIRAERDEKTVRCIVQDRGYGFAPDELHKAFDRLWRSPDPRVQAIRGGGIGLTIARAIVERHGGQIAIESAPDTGTTVTLSLPIVESW